MRTLLTALLALLALLVLAAFIVPALIDWNAQKPRIVAELERMTGRDVALEGELELRLLPRPRFAAERVRIANLPGGSEPSLLSARALEARLALWPLLRGRLEVEQARLVQPRILLERTPEGEINWELRPVGEGPQDRERSGSRPPGEGGGGPDIAIRDVRIENGSLLYRDPALGRDLQVRSIDARLALDSRTGPLSLEGRGESEGQPFTFALVLGRFSSQGPTAASLRVGLPQAGESRFEFTGRLVPHPSGLAAEGSLAAGGQSLGALAALFAPEAAKLAGLARQFDIKGELALDPEAMRAEDLDLRLGPTAASGDLLLRFGQQPSGQIALTLPRLDLDELLETGEGEAGASESGSAAEEAAEKPWSFALPERLRLELTCAVEAIVYRGQILRQARLDLLLDGGLLELREARTLLPGSAEVTLNGSLAADEGQPRFSGRIEAAADNLRGLLGWWGLEFPEVPTARLRRASLSGALDISPSLARLTELRAEIDTSRLSGGIALAPRKRLGLGVGIAIDRLNLDAYLPERAAKETTASGGKTAATLPFGGLALPPLFTAFDANLDLRVGDLTLQQVTARDLQLDATLLQSQLTLRRLSVEDLAGGSGQLSAVVKDATTEPQIERSLIEFSVSDTARLARALDQPGDGVLARLGTLGITARFAGTPAAFDYKLEGAIEEGSFSASGKVEGLPAALKVSGGRFGFRELAAARLADLLGTAADGPLLRLGPLSGELEYAGSAERLAYSLEVVLLEGRLTQSAVLQDLPSRPQLSEGRLRAEGLSAPALAEVLALPSDGPLAKLERLDLDGRFEGSFESLTYEATLSALEGNLRLAGSGKNLLEDRPELTASAKLAHPDVSALTAQLAGPGILAPDLGPLELAAELAGGPESLSIAGLTGTLGPVRLEGAGLLGFAGERPKLEARLAFGTLPLDRLLGPEAVQGAGDKPLVPLPAPARQEGARWSGEPFDLAALSELDGAIEVTAERLVTDGFSLEAPRLLAELAGGELRLEELSGGLSGGRLELRGKLDGSRPVSGLVLDLALALDKVELGPLFADVAGFERVSGPLTLDMSFAGRGRSEAELVERLDGEGKLGGALRILLKQEEQLGNILLGLLSEKVNEAEGPAAASDLLVRAFGNKPAALSGGLLLRRGVLRSDGVKLVGEGAEARVTGVLADLPDWTLDMEAEVVTAEDEAPRLTLALSGPLDDPNLRLKGAALMVRPLPEGRPSPPADGGKPAEKPSAEELIRGILRSLRQ